MISLVPKKDGHKELEVFFNKTLEIIFSKKSKEWEKIRKEYILYVFNESVKKVKAYKTFLSNFKKIKPELEKIPPVSKKNYLRFFPHNDLFKKGTLDNSSSTVTSTSGSTGVPFYFPRNSLIDMQSSVYHQIFLKNSKINKNKATLVIDCFGMGVWIGGIITYQAFKYISERGYSVSVITPGINKVEVFQALKNIGKHYSNIILTGYPPFIKDLVDEAFEYGVIWSDYSIKIIFAAESFSETFRDYIIEKTGIKDIYRDTMNIYGSADLGTMAEETPLSILVRRLSINNKKLFIRLFGEINRLPTLTQYIPSFVSFECNENRLLCTGDNMLPLVRYDIGDNGGVFSYDQLIKILKEEGVDIFDEIKKAKIENTITELPFVYVYERSDFSTSFYGAIIYPEYIKKVFLGNDLRDFLTGKFSMSTKYDEKQNQYLEISIEMKKGAKINSFLRKTVLNNIVNSLVSSSAEYSKIKESLGSKSLPKLEFCEYGDNRYFLSGTKQKWIKK